MDGGTETTSPQKGSLELAEQQEADSGATQETPSTPPKTDTSAAPANTSEPSSDSTENSEGLSYVDMWKKLNPYEPPTPPNNWRKSARKRSVTRFGRLLVTVCRLFPASFSLLSMPQCLYRTEHHVGGGAEPLGQVRERPQG